jgi:hypothetical protein
MIVLPAFAAPKGSAPLPTSPSIGRGNDDVMDIHNAQQAYLDQVCPEVARNPGGFSSSLQRFCQQYRPNPKAAQPAR